MEIFWKNSIDFHFYQASFMKKIILPLFIILLAGCQSKDEPDEIETTVVDTVVANSEKDITVTHNAELWYVDEGEVEKLHEPQNKTIETLSPQDLIAMLNQKNGDVQLVLDKVSKDTVFLSIPKSAYLTNQMGSTGAYNYLATVVYNFTELKPITYVRFSFEEGDHAAPGVYSRNDFKRLR